MSPKKLIISGTILSILILPTFNAKAGLFDWVSQTENSYLISPESLNKIYENFRGLQLTREEVRQDEEIEKSVIQETKKLVAENQITKQILEPKKIMVVIATAYSSTPDQTDSTPFITAWNTSVRDGIVAANFLPFGAQIKIPDVFGDKIFVVEDRMHNRYRYRVDIWFPERQMAKEFGIKQIRIEIVS